MPLDVSVEEIRSGELIDAVERGRQVLFDTAVESALDEMSPAMAVVNRCYFLDDDKAKEIAEERGVSVATVREQIRKGRKQLRERLAAWESS